MKFEVVVSFPGSEWNVAQSIVEFSDQSGEVRGEAKRTALSQLLSYCREQEKRNAKYGGKVSWEAVRA